MVAIRDIEVGEELTYHYGILESESSLIFGLQCKCDSINCCGRLTFDYYRKPEFVEKQFDYMTPYLKQKVIDMREKWYSSKCYVKRKATKENADKPLEEWEKGLFSLEPIKSGELVAKYSMGEVAREKHFIRHSINPTCHLIGLDVYASQDLPPETELTLSF